MIVGSFHLGTKHNIVSDKALPQLTVRNANLKTSKLLLDGIKRIAINRGRVAGLPDDKLPELIIGNESVPPTNNDAKLAQCLRAVWQQGMGKDRVLSDVI